MFTDMYLPKISGVTNFVSSYKRAYEAAGHQVFVFTFGNTSYQDPEPNIIRSFGIPAGDTGFNFSVLYSAEARALIPTMDVAHVHHPFQTGRLAAHQLREHGIPIVFTTHTRYDLYSDEYLDFIPVGPRHYMVKRELRHFLDECAAVTVHTPEIGQWLQQYVDYHDAVVVPVGIELDRFANPVQSTTRADVGLSDDDLVICHLGRIEHEKNVSYLLEEFFTVADTVPNAKLLVVGDGSALQELRDVTRGSRHPDRVVFAGPKPIEAVPDYLALADVFVTASVTETLGLVAIEAMATGLPVVGIDSPGIGECVENGVSGLLAQTGRRGALAHELTRIASDQELRDQLATGAAEQSRQFSLNEAAATMLDLFEQVRATR